MAGKKKDGAKKWLLVLGSGAIAYYLLVTSKGTAEPATTSAAETVAGTEAASNPELFLTFLA